jgi:nuclear pore complex protein Nup205
MAEDDSLEALRNLHQDLEELASSRLPVIEVLLLNLEVNIESFRRLLDKSGKNDASRKSISSGTVAWEYDTPSALLH